MKKRYLCGLIDFNKNQKRVVIRVVIRVVSPKKE